MAVEDPLFNGDDPERGADTDKLPRWVIVAIALTILCLSVFTISAGVMNYSRLKTFYVKYHAQKNDIAGLKRELANRNEELRKISGKLRAMETRLVDLAEFEKNIRNIAGVGEFSDRLSMFGVGGEVSEEFEDDSIWQDPETLVEYLEDRFELFDDSASRRTQSLQALYDILKTQEELLAVTPCIRPVDGGWVTSPFGYRKSPFTGQREYHTGIDIAIRSGSKVKATADGVVTHTGYLGGLGKAVVVDHGFGIVTRYGHLKKIDVSEQQEVKKGEIIAQTGNSGRSTGPHIHYEIRFNDIPMNAEKYMAPYLAESFTRTYR